MNTDTASAAAQSDGSTGRAFLSAMQALVRLPLMQRSRDVAAGLNTAGFISGYRGSPLGGYDLALMKERTALADAHVRFEPGVNEDLAATAVWGTQQAHLLPGAKYDGVFAIWYGKGAGVDRSGDPIKHGNRMGTAAHGGVVLVFGDDHTGKSSSVAHQSEQALAANGVPVLYPATVQEYLDFGLYAFALSRVAGVWVGLKCISETAETTRSVDVDTGRLHIVEPPIEEAVATEIRARWALDPLGDDIRLTRHKLPTAQAFVRVNGLDRVTHGESSTADGAEPRTLGIVAAGKSWLDVSEALRSLGLEADGLRRNRVAVYKPALIWPLETEGLVAFARGRRELLFVEEKAAFMELQAAHALFNLPVGVRPRIIGKRDESGQPLVAADVALNPLEIALVIGRRLRELGVADASVLKRLEKIEHSLELARERHGSVVTRQPYFCSGCPHNSSTRVPAGSLALAGIGCHTMAIGMNRHTMPPTHMGGEGANWTGLAHFTELQHVFQNLGDGTYFHSGLLAIRAAVTAGVNITYKILVNDAVAMTGGQRVEGQLSVAEISQQLRAECVQRIAVVSDDPAKYGGVAHFAKGVTVHARAELDAVQNELREVKGVSALIYDQTCAIEKRRRRKRSKEKVLQQRVVINEMVCEGCGDCSATSNCVSVEPLETEFGRKRRIEQSSCNTDYSCVSGFCPSFITVRGGTPRTLPVLQRLDAEAGPIPEPVRAPLADVVSVLIAGIGGTGVVTVAAILGTAAHFEGLSASIVDMTGLAQKGGAVQSHLKIAKRDEFIATSRIGMLDCDLVLGCDLVTTASAEVLRTINAHTRIVINADVTPTAAFQRNPDFDARTGELISLIRAVAGESCIDSINATQSAARILGDTIATNIFMVGFTLQKGLLPVGRAAVERAIELNGARVELNRQALLLGRLAAHSPARLLALLAQVSPPATAIATSLVDRIRVRRQYLVRYQNEIYAKRYERLVERTLRIERERGLNGSPLADAVCRNYFTLLAYKDEYEVARLLSDAAFHRKLRDQWEGPLNLTFHLAPPIFARTDPSTGLPRKSEFRASLLRPLLWVLGNLRFLRGTVLDIFGYTRERREERTLILEYERMLEALLAHLNHDNHADAASIASWPEQVRGFGHVKKRHVVAARNKRDRLLAQFLGQRAPRP